MGRTTYRERRINRLEDFKKSGVLDSFKKHSEYHYSKVIKGKLFTWYPSSHKYMIERTQFHYCHNILIDAQEAMEMLENGTKFEDIVKKKF